jgi:hypothetical protein
VVAADIARRPELDPVRDRGLTEAVLREEADALPVKLELERGSRTPQALDADMPELQLCSSSSRRI